MYRVLVPTSNEFYDLTKTATLELLVSTLHLQKYVKLIHSNTTFVEI